MLAIQNFQQRLYSRYKHSLSLPPSYKYIHGNPVQPIVPVETRTKPVCIIGDYPSARLGTIGPEQAVPIEDVCRPFAVEPYFDGRRVRDEAPWLERFYLTPLGLRREQCWLTYLVKVFLFKDEHLAKYRRLNCAWPEGETYSHFRVLARQSLDWLTEELALIRPRLVITLGREVAEVLQAVPGFSPEDLLGGHLQDLWLDEAVYPALHLDAPIAPPKHLIAGREVVRRLVKKDLKRGLGD